MNDNIIHRHIQDGRLSDENARGRVHSREENRQDIQTDGRETRPKTFARLTHTFLLLPGVDKVLYLSVA